MQLIDLMVERVWPVARRIVLSWSDQASEIFIIDLPDRDLGRILDVIAAMTHQPVVLRLDGLNLDTELPLTPGLRERMVRRCSRSTVHSLRGQVLDRACCYFYLWLNAEAQTLEVELVFWNDLCFPAGKPVSDHKVVLGRMLRIAHAIRGENHRSKCILSSEYNSSPRELLQSKEVAIW